jgi:hypothetical protein
MIGGKNTKAQAPQSASGGTPPSSAAEPPRNVQKRRANRDPLTAFERVIGRFRVVRSVQDTGRLIDQHVEDGSTPYFHACRISTPDLSKIEFDKCPGLLSCQAVQDGTGAHQAYSYWGNQECFTLYGASLMSQLPAPEETQKGYIAYSKTKPRTVWQRFPFWTVVITVSAVIGAGAGLWEYGAGLVERPDITVTFKRDNRPNFQATEAPVISFSVTNQDRWAPAAIRIRGAIVPMSDPPLKTMPETSRLSRIEPGKSSDFDLEGTALEVASNPGRYEELELRLAITASSGLLRKGREFQISSGVFRHWQTVGSSRPEVRATDNACYFTGTLYAGRAGNASGYVTVSMSSKVDSVTTTLTGPDIQVTHFYDSEPSPSEELRRQEFNTPALSLYGEYQYTIKVISQGASTATCSKLAQANDLVHFQ